MKIISLMIFMLALTGCHFQGDSLGEEILESVIDYETGLDIDLTPATPEHGFSPKHLFPFERKPSPANAPAKDPVKKK